MDLWVGLLVLLVSSSFWIADARSNPRLNVVASILFGCAYEPAGFAVSTCTLCEEFTGEALGYIGDNKTQTEIIDVLHKSCARAVSFKQETNEMRHHKVNLNGYLSYHTGQNLEKINQDTDRDFFMRAKEAKDYGLIDGVIMNALKALQPSTAS